MSPVAQDFYAAFRLGEDDEHLSALDTNGVALAAIQGLHELSQEQAAHIGELEAEGAALRAQLHSAERMNAAQQAQIDDLTARLEALEQGASRPGGAGSSGASSSGLQGSLLPGAGMLMLAAAAVWGARRKGGIP
jgi:hypothetical protein